LTLSVWRASVDVFGTRETKQLIPLCLYCGARVGLEESYFPGPISAGMLCPEGNMPFFTFEECQFIPLFLAAISLLIS
jgi:hypothetical protein